MRQGRARQIRNRAQSSALRTALKRVRAATTAEQAGAAYRVAARCDGGTAARGGSDGIVGWNWAPLARRGDGAAPVSSSVTDLMNSSSSTWAGLCGGSGGMMMGGAAWRAGGVGAGAAAGLGA